MILLLKLWLGWHALLGVVAITQRLPLAWWQKLPNGTALRMKFVARFWVKLEYRDGWLGYFWDADRRRLYVCLCPYVLARFDLARRGEKQDGFARLCSVLFGECRMTGQAKRLTNDQLGVKLCDSVWSKFAMGTAPSVIVGEAIDRLRSMPSPTSGAARIARERLRQIQEEDFTFARDDAYTSGQLTDAAMCFNLAADGMLHRGWDVDRARAEMLAFCWPWPAEWAKPKQTPAGNYVIAGALIAAEIDRLDRTLGSRLRAELQRKAAP